MAAIKEHYFQDGKYQVRRAIQKNIMLIGRTRTGKSTIKMLLVDPTTVPNDLTLKSGTKDPLFESFFVDDNHIVLNIIDTPGLFEHGTSELDIRDNNTILSTIDLCANREITKFHVICFCVAITNGINQEDIESLQLLVQFLGSEISRNSCLIVTRCEMKDESQRAALRAELLNDVHFKPIADFFQKGIFFSGSLNYDDYKKGSDSLCDQFLMISEYRSQLIEMFTSETEPFPITEMAISEIRRCRNELKAKDEALIEVTQRTEEQKRIHDFLQTELLNDQNGKDKIIQGLQQQSMLDRRENERLRAQTNRQLKTCSIS
jgi:GTPase Era involved in 16S rRNA processing